MRRLLNTLALLTLAIPLSALFSATAAANDASAEQRGREIAQEQDRRDQGWKTSEAELEMVLRRANGQETRRKLRIKLLEVEGDGDKGLTVFDEPRDVQGTKFLNYSHALEPDEQWLYLPALRRTKRISSKNKTGRFMGSEFSYEDMSATQLEKYDYAFLREDTLNEQPVFVVESYPKDKFSGYSKQVLYIDQAEYRTLKVEFYDRRESLLKVLTMHGYSQYLDKFWRAATFTMQNEQTGKSTDLNWSNYRFDVGLSEADFHRSGLERAR